MRHDPALHVCDAAPAEHVVVALDDSDGVRVGGDHRNLRLADDRRCCDTREAERAAVKGNDAVSLHRFADNGDRFLTIAAVIVDHKLDFAAADAPHLIRLPDGELRAVPSLCADTREPPGQRAKEAQLDCRLTGRRAWQEDKPEVRQRECAQSLEKSSARDHASVPPVARGAASRPYATYRPPPAPQTYSL